MLISSLSVTAMSISALSAPASLRYQGVLHFLHSPNIETLSKPLKGGRLLIDNSDVVCSSARCSASVPPTCPAPRIMIFTGSGPQRPAHTLSGVRHSMWITYVRLEACGSILWFFQKRKKSPSVPWGSGRVASHAPSRCPSGASGWKHSLCAPTKRVMTSSFLRSTEQVT